MEKKYFAGTMAMLVMAVMVVGLMGVSQAPSQVGDAVAYHSNVCVYKNGEEIGCQPNVVTNQGLDFIKTSIGVGTNNTIIDLGLGNQSAPAAGATDLAGRYEDSGLARATGSYTSNGVGNWSIDYTWTSSGDDKVVNTTGLFKTGTNELFAGTSFTSTTLQTDDQIKVTYTVWVTGS